jgi:hypothetical protein
MSELRVAPTGATQFPGGWAVLRAPDDVPERLRRAIGRSRAKIVRFQSMIEAIEAVVAKDATGLPAPAEDMTGAEGPPTPAVRGAIPAQAVTEGAEFMDAIAEIEDTTILAFVTEWSWPAALTIEGIGDLPGAVYKRLVETVGPLRDALFVDFDDPGTDKTSPTGPSSA